MAERRIRVSGVGLRVEEHGSGDPVLLLHGFPDSALLWRNQIPALVDAGYRVVVPDLRGFGESDKPQNVDAYSADQLVGDALGILDALGIERTHVISHDWGAFIGWALAALAPGKVESLAALAVGHPASFLGAGLDQREKSWYMLLFQFAAAEQLIVADNWKWLRDFTRHHSELAHWIKDLERPGALTAALNWYRANANPENPTPAAGFPNVSCPTFGIWASQDAYLTESQMLGSTAYVHGMWRYERIEGASHWMQLDQPERINQLLLSFLRS
jgi:pimeloyl-ACP methyl ester carboxylesterase